MLLFLAYLKLGIPILLLTKISTGKNSDFCVGLYAMVMCI